MSMKRGDAITTLNKLGFDVVRFPRPDIAPLDVVIEFDGRFTRLGPLTSMWRSTGQPPTNQTGSVGDVRSIRSSEIKGGVSVKAGFANLLAHLGLGAKVENVASVQLVARNPVLTWCPRDQLENYVAHGSQDRSAAASRHLVEERNRAFIVTDVVASGQLEVIIGGQTKAEAEASAADAMKSIEANANFSHARVEGDTIAYEKTPPLVFGFASSELYHDGGWKLDLPEQTGRKFLGGSRAGTARNAGKEVDMLDLIE